MASLTDMFYSKEILCVTCQRVPYIPYWTNILWNMHIVLVLTLTKEIQKDISHSTFWKRCLLDNHLLMPRLGALRKILKYKTLFSYFYQYFAAWQTKIPWFLIFFPFTKVIVHTSKIISDYSINNFDSYLAISFHLYKAPYETIGKRIKRTVIMLSTRDLNSSKVIW